LIAPAIIGLVGLAAILLWRQIKNPLAEEQHSDLNYAANL